MRTAFGLSPEGGDCFIIAEVAQSHDGSLGTAHAYIDLAAEVGADAVKFQTHIAEAESTPGEPWRVRFSPQDETRFDYWKRMEFTAQQWRGLKDHADERGLVFLSSPFSAAAVRLLRDLGVAGWKVASGETSNEPFLEDLAADGIPIILSSGMSPYAEIERAVEVVGGRAPVCVLQCTTSYPCPPEKTGLNVLGELQRRLPGVPVGLSDHSGTIYPGLAAVALGATALEVHITLSRAAFGPDVSSSLEPDDFRRLVEGARFIERSLRHPVDKDAMASEMEDLRRLFTKSLVTSQAVPAGEQLTDANVTTKKPGTGIPAAEFRTMLGRRVARDLPADHLLTPADLEPAP